MAQAFFGGVHPNDMKAATNEKAIEQLAAPAEVVIPMSMHIGAPCKPIVAVGDKVTIGQKIGEPGGFVSAPIHASVSGTVKAVEPRPFSMGGTMMSVVIENDFQNTVCPDIHPVDDPDSLTPEQLVEIVKNAGIVGQGGATFPTHVKISSGLGKVDYVIINAAECEPYITGDHRTMLERPEQVIKGATLLAKCFGVEHVYIGVEANKQNAADVLNKTIDELKAPVVVEVLHTRYPQGAEKQLCQAISGRQVPVHQHVMHGSDELPGNLEVLSDLLRLKSEITEASLLPDIHYKDADLKPKFYPENWKFHNKDKNADAVLKVGKKEHWVADFKRLQGSGKHLAPHLEKAAQQADYAVIKLSETHNEGLFSMQATIQRKLETTELKGVIIIGHDGST